jgi:hypothetical protein
VTAELFDIPSLNKDNSNNLVEIEGLEHCKKALKTHPRASGEYEGIISIPKCLIAHPN